MAKPKILFVEDEAEMAELLKMHLEAHGMEIITAETGKEGLLKALSEKPDLILADVMMPDMDGIEMTRVIRSTTDLKATPIIMVTALGREQDMEKAKAAGADEYVVKPFEFKELLKTIQKHLA